MRNLSLNKRAYVALNYIGKTDVLDEQGYKTGESKIEYSREIPFETHLSGAKGSSQVEVFGIDVKYDKVFILTLWEFKRLGFNENTVFFIDKKPEYDTDHRPLYDYRVRRIADTLNEVAIAIEKVSQ